MSIPPTIALITDFGTVDPYAGILRGVLCGIAPQAQVIDITHSIPAGDIRRGALTLWEAQPFFPDQTIFLVVVDPSVGSSRKPMVCRFPNFDVICPDNGLLTFLMQRYENWGARAISNRRYFPSETSGTFHGRDIFAPAAAHLARGAEFTDFGEILADPIRLELPRLVGNGETGWEGETLYADAFGNVITSIGRISFDRKTFKPWTHSGAKGGTLTSDALVLLSDGMKIPFAPSYAEGQVQHTLFGLVGSAGLLEIASWRARASNAPALQIGSSIRLIPGA